MFDFLEVNGPAFYFYEGRIARLEGQSELARVGLRRDQAMVGDWTAAAKPLTAFVAEGEPGFIVEGEMLELFASLASEVANRASGEYWRYDYDFQPLGRKSIEIVSNRYGGRTSIKTVLLPESLLDSRERLVMILNEILPRLRKRFD